MGIDGPDSVKAVLTAWFGMATATKGEGPALERNVNDASLVLEDIHVAEYPREYVDRLVCKNHYLEGQPSPQTIYRYLITGGIRWGVVGGAMWGKPVARMEDQENTLELLRFWTEDYTPKNTESYAIGQMIRDIKRKGTHDRLIAYASTGQDHDGGIYKATNWEDLGVRGTNTGDGWATRKNRHNDDPSPKRKFEYLPGGSRE